MAIIKQAKAIISNSVKYTVGAKKITEIAEKVNIEAKYENLALVSNKKVQIEGNKS